MRILLLCLLMAGGLQIAIAQPANDNCADAIAIGEVTDLAFSNIDATTDGPFHENSPCPGSGDPDSLYNDIWYVFTPTFTGNALWTLCGTADFDTKIAVYNPGSACPPEDGDLLTCNEDAGTCALSTSEVIFAVAEGQSYLLRLAGFGEASPGEEGMGTFSVAEFISAVPNDFCKDAIAVTVGEDQPFASTGAITDGPEHPNNSACFGFGDNTVQNDIWYSFTPDFTGSVEWSTCNAASFDTRLAVYAPDATCPVEDGDLYACNDDGSSCSDYSSRVIFSVEEGMTYILRLGGYNGATGTGTFDLINTSPPDPPDNDLCKNAEAIEVLEIGSPGGYEGTTIDATFDLGNFTFPTCLANQSGGEFAEVWYAFNSLGNVNLDLVFGFTTTDAEFYIDLWDGCGTGPVDTAIIENSCFFANDINDLLTVQFGNLPDTPTVYLMRVVTRLTGALPGDFFFQLMGDITSATNELPDVFESLSLVPNPVADVASMHFTLKESSPVQMAVFDISGRQHWMSEQLHFPAGNSNHAIPTGDLMPGMYLLKVSTDRGGYHVKFVKS